MAIAIEANNFPDYWDAPHKLLRCEGCCGLIAAWGVLKYFRRRASAAQLIDSCRYTKKHGVFTISLAVALREHGLSVTFYGEPDPQPKLIEQRCYRSAENIGVRIEPAIALDMLLAQVSQNHVPIISYNTDEDNGHLSPILGVENDKVILPYSDEGMMSKAELCNRWSAPEIFRQCLIVSI